MFGKAKEDDIISKYPLVFGSLFTNLKRSNWQIKDNDIVLTEVSIGSVILALLTNINNVSATSKSPNCSYREMWRLDDSAKCAGTK